MIKFSRASTFIVITILSLGIVAFGQAGDVDEGDQGSKVTRIGVIMPKVSLMEAKGEIEPGAALRNTYAALLNSETILIVALDARLTTLALEEAAKKEVDYILNLSLMQESKKSSGGGLFGRVARSAGRQATWETSRQVPYGGTAAGRVGTAAARSAIINTGYTMSNMTYKVNKSDKFTLDYLLTDPKGKTILEKSIDGKAKSKNDDKILLALIEQSANDIAGAVIKP